MSKKRNPYIFKKRNSSHKHSFLFYPPSYFQFRTDELALLREVKQIVQEELSGLRETTEEAIKNSDITVWTA